MIRAVLFDFGHTLMDFARTEEALRDAYVEVRTRLAQWVVDRAPPDVDELVERIANAVDALVVRSYEERRLEELDHIGLFEQAFEAIGYRLPRELVREVAELDHDALSAALTTSEEAISTLERLRAMGYRIGLVSNASLLPHKLRGDLERLGLARLLDAVAFSSEVGVRKPDPRIFLTVLRALEVPAGRTAFVGDRLLDDIAGAQALGMRTILTQEYRKEEPGDIVPDAVVSTIADVPDVVASWTDPRYGRAR